MQLDPDDLSSTQISRLHSPSPIRDRSEVGMTPSDKFFASLRDDVLSKIDESMTRATALSPMKEGGNRKPNFSSGGVDPRKARSTTPAGGSQWADREPIGSSIQRPATVMGTEGSSGKALAGSAALGLRGGKAGRRAKGAVATADNPLNVVKPHQHMMLSQYIRGETTRTKNDVELLFRRLDHRTERRSGADTRQGHEQKERVRHKKYEEAVENVFRPTCGLLESFWGKFRVGQEEQRRFTDSRFKVPNVDNYNAISREVNKYSIRNEYVSGILTLMNIRETYLETLLHWSKKAALLDNNNKSVQESAVIEVFNMILLLRHVTCEIIDAIYVYREAEGMPVPLMWEGRNYIIKMQDDLLPLADTNFSIILPGYQFRGNPMLLPPKYFDANAPPPEHIFGIGDEVQQLLKEKKKGPGISIIELMGGVVEKRNAKGGKLGLRSGKSLTGQSMEASSFGGGKNTSKTTTTSGGDATNTTDAGGEESDVQMGSLLPAAKQANITFLHEGEEAPSRTAPTLRSQYFQKLAQREQRSANVKEKSERHNVYHYPNSVYAPKLRPCWMLSGEILMRSLDPEVCVLHKKYDERVDYEQMQFGRTSTPPILSVVQPESVLDIETNTYRMSAPVPNYTYAEMHKREVLIFGESKLVKKLTAKKKVQRGMMKLKMAYRGFTAQLYRMRTQHQTSIRSIANIARAADSFKDWVAEFAPDWHQEVVEELGEQAYQEMLIYDEGNADFEEGYDDM